MTKQKIFIKKIELTDFESHKHTVLDNLSDGFNIITADSDVGKTSVLRALMLCAYNQFNPESVRLGAPYCDVTVTSNIGYVNVKRGPGMNMWTVKRDDGQEMVFDKVGRNEVKEACAVLGMKMIQLGDIFIPVNIMNQLEGHFLINSVGDDKTTGSGRAQIIDEICGLNGAEELIKNISLDQYRITRKITESEEKIKGLQAQLHSEHDIKNDEEILERLNQLEENIQVCQNNKDYIDGIISSYKDLLDQKKSVEEKVSSLPSSDNAISLTDDSFALLSKLSVIENILADYNVVLKRLSLNRDKQKDLPDVQNISDDWKEWMKKLELYNSLIRDYESGNRKLKDVRDKLSSLNNSDISALLTESQSAVEKLDKCQHLSKEHIDLTVNIERVRKSLKERENELIVVETEISDIYKTIDVCPITKLPITDKCSLVGARGIV